MAAVSVAAEVASVVSEAAALAAAEQGEAGRIASCDFRFSIF